MVRRIASLLMLGLCVLAVAGCVVVPAGPPPRPHADWMPGHYNGWRWVPGHWA